MSLFNPYRPSFSFTLSARRYNLALTWQVRKSITTSLHVPQPCRSTAEPVPKEPCKDVHGLPTFTNLLQTGHEYVCLGVWTIPMLQTLRALGTAAFRNNDGVVVASSVQDSLSN